MAGLWEKFLSLPLLNMILARRRFLVLFLLSTFLLMLMFSGIGNVDMTRLSVSGTNPAGAPGTAPRPAHPAPPPAKPDVPVPAEQPAAPPPEQAAKPQEPQAEPPKPVDPRPETPPKGPESKSPPPALSPRPYVSYHGYQRPGYDLPLNRAIPLRIMAMGSATAFDHDGGGGNADTDNGYRLPLREKLTAIGNKVNYVGDASRGNMMDNEVVAASPDKPPTVDALREVAAKVVPGTKPNLYIVSTGAQDAFKHLDVARFYVRMDALVHYLLDASHRSTVILTTLPLPRDSSEQNGVREEISHINEQIRRLVNIYAKEGQPVVLAELQGPDAVPPPPPTAATPNGEDAAVKVAELLTTAKIFEAILEADARGFLQAPEYVEGLPDDGDWDARTTSAEFRQWEADKEKYFAQQKQINEKEISRMEAELKKVKEGRKAAPSPSPSPSRSS